MERDEITHDAVVELERALELGQHFRVDAEVRDDVVAVLLGADRIGELTTPPVIDGEVFGGAEQTVKPSQLVADGGVLECRIEEIHRLVCARHVGNPPFGHEPPPAGCRARGEGDMRGTGRAPASEA